MRETYTERKREKARSEILPLGKREIVNDRLEKTDIGR